MSRVLGYGGLANSRARDFSGKSEAEVVPATRTALSIAVRVGLSIALLLLA